VAALALHRMQWRCSCHPSTTGVVPPCFVRLTARLSHARGCVIARVADRTEADARAAFSGADDGDDLSASVAADGDDDSDGEGNAHKDAEEEQGANNGDSRSVCTLRRCVCVLPRLRSPPFTLLSPHKIHHD
jgi:hypothetical protein